MTMNRISKKQIGIIIKTKKIKKKIVKFMIIVWLILIVTKYLNYCLLIQQKTKTKTNKHIFWRLKYK